MPPRWLPRVLARIRELAARREVAFTMKALRELAALGMGLDEEDACDVLASLTSREFQGRVRSKRADEWMYVFRLEVGGVRVYLKVALRTECIVISFHEEGDHGHEGA